VPSPQQVARFRAVTFLDSINQFRASFDAAAAQVGVVHRDMLLAGNRIRLQFAGPALVPVIEPAFDHLVQPSDEQTTDFTVSIWDAASTGVRPLPLPADVLHHGETGPRYHGEESGIVVHAADATLSVVDATRQTALHYLPDASNVLWYQEATPLKDIVHAWTRWHDLQLIHAAAVGNHDGGVLIAGGAGSGKSTTSLACLRGGLRYAGDDYVLVDVERAFVHSLYSSAKLEWDNFDRHPELFGPANSRADAKALAFLARDAPERMAHGFPLRALLLPTITRRDKTRAVPTTSAKALLGLAPSTMLQMPGHDQPSLAAMTQLAERLPAFRLELGANLSMIPDVVEAVLTDVTGR
jgi:hypothetical protein